MIFLLSALFFPFLFVHFGLCLLHQGLPMSVFSLARNSIQKGDPKMLFEGKNAVDWRLMVLTVSDKGGTMLFYLRSFNNSLCKCFVLSQFFELRIEPLQATSKLYCHPHSASQKRKEGQRPPTAQHRISLSFPFSNSGPHPVLSFSCSSWAESPYINFARNRNFISSAGVGLGI